LLINCLRIINRYLIPLFLLPFNFIDLWIEWHNTGNMSLYEIVIQSFQSLSFFFDWWQNFVIILPKLLYRNSRQVLYAIPNLNFSEFLITLINWDELWIILKSTLSTSIDWIITLDRFFRFINSCTIWWAPCVECKLFALRYFWQQFLSRRSFKGIIIVRIDR
jgi:hypothetical protein